MIDLDQDSLESVKIILAEFAPQCEVRVFGSRISGRARRFSDLDLALVCSFPIPRDVLTRLNIAFSESDLVFRVDVLDYSAVDSAFQKLIDNDYEVIHSPVPADRVADKNTDYPN